jgi:hypothetical protein
MPAEVEALESRLCLGWAGAFVEDASPPPATVGGASPTATEIEWLDGRSTAAPSAAIAWYQEITTDVDHAADDPAANGRNEGSLPSHGQPMPTALAVSPSSTLDVPWAFRSLSALEEDELPGEWHAGDSPSLSAAAGPSAWLGAQSQAIAPVAIAGGAASEQAAAPATGAQPTNTISAQPVQASGPVFIAPPPVTEDAGDTASGPGTAADGPTATLPASVLYLNFDGVSIGADDLARWSQDWSLPGDALDPSGQGIRVDPFLQGTPGWQQREAVIATMLDLLRADLAPFGVEVRRHDGAAVEGVGATTIFLGRSSTYLGHLAGDIDQGNNNRTDIAFVANEWWGNARDTAYALTDVALHEAGHTYGLVHVDVRQEGALFPDTMGLRYSTGQDQWVRDTAFVDRAFVELGANGEVVRVQNSYQAMLAAFGLTGQLENSAPQADEPPQVAGHLDAGAVDAGAVDVAHIDAGDAARNASPCGCPFCAGTLWQTQWA